MIFFLNNRKDERNGNKTNKPAQSAWSLNSGCDHSSTSGTSIAFIIGLK